MRVWAPGVLLVVLLTVLVGCGASGTPEEIVAASADVTGQAGTARMDLRVAFTGEDVPEGFEFGGEGVIDLPAGTAEMTMDLGGLPMAGAGSISMIVDGNTLYLQLPGLGGRTQWFRLDTEDMAGALGTGTTAGTTNPAQQLDVLRGVTGDVEQAGSEEVRGEPTTRYEFTVDVAEALAELPEEQRAALRDVSEAMDTDELPVSVWIDGEGRTRRLRYDFELPPSATGGPSGGRTTVTLEYFDFGVDVAVEPPPEDDVIDFNDMFEELQEFGGDTEMPPVP